MINNFILWTLTKCRTPQRACVLLTANRTLTPPDIEPTDLSTTSPSLRWPLTPIPIQPGLLSIASLTEVNFQTLFLVRFLTTITRLTTFSHSRSHLNTIVPHTLSLCGLREWWLSPLLPLKIAELRCRHQCQPSSWHKRRNTTLHQKLTQPEDLLVN